MSSHTPGPKMCKERVQAIEALNAELLQRLESLQWVMGNWCPVCEETSMEGHAPECSLNDLIKRTKGETRMSMPDFGESLIQEMEDALVPSGDGSILVAIPAGQLARWYEEVKALSDLADDCWQVSMGDNL